MNSNTLISPAETVSLLINSLLAHRYLAVVGSPREIRPYLSRIVAWYANMNEGLQRDWRVVIVVDNRRVVSLGEVDEFLRFGRTRLFRDSTTSGFGSIRVISVDSREKLMGIQGDDILFVVFGCDDSDVFQIIESTLCGRALLLAVNPPVEVAHLIEGIVSLEIAP